jgi:hypothetical protein
MKRAVSLTVMFGVEVLLIEAVGIPFSLNFDMWAFMDAGGNLTAPFLIQQGYRPVIDFGYIYGLLPLLVERLWLELAGASPSACMVLVTACNLLVGWALARFAVSLGLRGTGIFLIAATLPFAIQANYPGITHALEAALLANGLAEQAAGRRATALALATMACLTKPSMGYVYGALLLGFEALSLWQHRRANALALALVKRITVAAAIGIIIVGVLALTFGTLPLVRTLLPTGGIKVYKAMHHGFFQEGRNFWYFPGVHVGYYLGTVVGFWLLGTFWLIAGGARALLRMIRDFAADTSVRNDEEIVFSCATMHLAFVLLFFGNAFSWFYYSYMLVMGVAATSAWEGSARYAVWSLTLIALVGQKTFVKDSYQRWIATAPTRGTAQLWASPEESAEWLKVLTLVRADERRGRPRTALLARTGCAELLFPEFAKPVSLYLDPGIPTDEEVMRKAAQLRQASAVVVVGHSLRATWPPFDAALAGRTPEFHGKFFDIYR